MATALVTNDTYAADGARTATTLYDDGTVTIVDGAGVTVTVAATPDTIAQAQAIVAANVEAQNEAAVNAKVDNALTQLAAYQAQVAAARTTVANLKATAATKSTTATATSAEVRAIYSGVATVCAQLDALIVASDAATRATAAALRLATGRLDATTGT